MSAKSATLLAMTPSSSVICPVTPNSKHKRDPEYGGQDSRRAILEASKLTEHLPEHLTSFEVAPTLWLASSTSKVVDAASAPGHNHAADPADE